MNLHEYQAKILFEDYGIPVLPGKAAYSAIEAASMAATLGGDAWLVKAQIHAGGRGKAGGVKMAHDRATVETLARGLLGTRLVTHQTSTYGLPVDSVLVSPAVNIVRELYLGMVVDRESRRIAIMISSAGGMDIEQVAASTPTKILTLSIDPILGLMDHQCRRAGFFLELTSTQRKQLGGILHSLYRLFTERDLSLVEINPLAIIDSGDLLALDAKINVDDNALYRQQIAEWRDPNQEDPKERAAKSYDLNYVKLDGDIGCMVNGAGLAMATMDIIKLHGGKPANFLDVGGGATAQRVAEAFKLIMSVPQIRAILVNIFGGIVRCDLIAAGIIQAVQEVGIDIPVVVRLEGTNVTAGNDALRNSGLKIISAADLDDAAQQVVAAAASGNT